MKRITVLSLAACTILLLTHIHGVTCKSTQQDVLEHTTVIEDSSMEQSDYYLPISRMGRMMGNQRQIVPSVPRVCPPGCQYSSIFTQCLPKHPNTRRVNCK
uniref:Uncharacterized protein n=1 Tax=Anopheles albimanus TaxID=7167 RepID=A0A182FXK8_ANOAL